MSRHVAFHKSHFPFIDKMSKSPIQSQAKVVIIVSFTLTFACHLPIDLSLSPYFSYIIYRHSNLHVLNDSPSSNSTPNVSSVPSASVSFFISHKSITSPRNELAILSEPIPSFIDIVNSLNNDL